MLLADDMVIICNSQEDLQQKLISLFEYCNLWGLEMNTAKTKIVVDQFFLMNVGFIIMKLWKLLSHFNYLDVVFYFTGSFVLNNQYLIGKALKAMNV
jgi:hypothetical protein